LRRIFSITGELHTQREDDSGSLQREGQRDPPGCLCSVPASTRRLQTNLHTRQK
ncbi:hypothetical protein KUCAC02_019366, partial [Chaenocephalus aceratus]